MSSGTRRVKAWSARFAPQLRGKRVMVLGIPDWFDYMAPDLVHLLRQNVPRYLPARGVGA